jgi:hypothetical protein
MLTELFIKGRALINCMRGGLKNNRFKMKCAVAAAISCNEQVQQASLQKRKCSRKQLQPVGAGAAGKPAEAQVQQKAAAARWCRCSKVAKSASAEACVRRCSSGLAPDGTASAEPTSSAILKRTQTSTGMEALKKLVIQNRKSGPCENTDGRAAAML